MVATQVPLAASALSMGQTRSLYTRSRLSALLYRQSPLRGSVNSVPIVMFVPRGPIGKIICRARLLDTIEHIKTMQMAIFVGLPTCLRCLSGLLP
jgi:hypothetical protein